MKIFLDDDDKSIDIDSFVSSLQRYINPGDFIYVEMDLMSFGRLYNPEISRDEFLEAFFQIFYELIGPKGHMSFPSFSYSWGCDKDSKIFDKLSTPGKVGVFPEFIRNRLNSFRTNDPMFSVVVHGPKAEEISCITPSSFGQGSFFHKLHGFNAKLISFGLNQYDPTFVHYAEQFFDENIRKINYRKSINFSGILIENNISKEAEHEAFMRDLNSGLMFNDKNLKRDLMSKNKLNSLKIGVGDIYISDSKDVFDTCIEGMTMEPYYLCKSI